MLDFNTGITQDEVFQENGVEGWIDLRAKFPNLFLDEADEQERGAEQQPEPKVATNDPGRSGQRSASGERYVKTSAVKQAVHGRELDVLHRLGIDWTGSRGHIDCPYPRHGGASDWRWAEDKQRAFCSCMGKAGEKKAHTIFDVVMHRIGADFDTAKIHVAELIGRSDLIKTKGGGGAYQKTDAESLLSPPAENRDDDIVWNYLAGRLGVEPDAVPRPRTAVAGHRSLAYFDPPATKGGKPKLVESTPCAVFGQVGRDGRRHAHRIYTGPDGRGKADLGTGPNGEPRDPKKSAKVAEGDNTAGRVVLWGNPDTATLVIALEGIETAAAAALAMRPEIEAGEVLVVSGISANGLEAFQPWPATKQLIVGADRDEGIKPDGRERDRRGERAARTLCMRHNGTIRCGIALPGRAGEKVDWLDILLRDGVEAVRNGILKAVEFVPTQADVEIATRRQSRDAELDEIAKTYPLPPMEALRLAYMHTITGRVMVHKIVYVKHEQKLEAIATPFGIPARLRHADQADAYGLRCVVQDMRGNPRAIDFQRKMLAKSYATEIRSLLFQAGLRTEGDGDMVVVQCLKAADPDREIIVVKQPGWQYIDGYLDPIFVGPDGSVLGAPDGVDIELAASVRLPADVAQAGTLDDWRAAVAIAVSVLDCEHWVLGAAGAFAGTLVNLVRMPTCGINFSGLTSLGKSTGQRLGVSAWSTPDIRREGLFQSANITGNSMEPVAQNASGTILAWDEFGLIPGKVLGVMLYSLSSDSGKKRMNADSSLRETYNWSTFGMFSCECSLEEKVSSEGGEWKAGMAVRFPDIDVTGVNGKVDRPTLDAIDGIERNYGHAGPAFVRALVEHGLHRQASALRERIFKAAGFIAGTTDSKTVRAAIPFALLLVAGELAVRFELAPADTRIEEAVQWAWDRFKRSSDAAALDPETQTITNLRQWIAERWDVTIKPVGVGEVNNNREAHGWYDDRAVYIPKGRIREAAGNALKESQIGKILDEHGLLAARPEPDRYYIRTVPKAGKVPAYALSRKEFGRSQYDIHADGFTVHEGRQHG